MNGVAVDPEAFLAQLEELPELKPFPAAAARLIAECKDPELSPKRVAEIVSCDAVLASRLLKVANSPLYGYAGKIRSIEHSVVVLGMSKIRNLAMAMAGAELFAGGQAAAAERQQLWRHSLQVAATARQLAARCPDLVAEEAFLAGIFHDIGKLVFYDLAAEAYLQLDPSDEPDQRVAAEQETFGIDHAELGMDCADTWGLPAEIAGAMGQHHDLESARDEGPLAVGTHLANSLAKLWQLDDAEAEIDESVWQAAAEAAQQCGLPVDAEQLPEIREAAVADFAETEQAYSV